MHDSDEFVQSIPTKKKKVLLEEKVETSLLMREGGGELEEHL